MEKLLQAAKLYSDLLKISISQYHDIVYLFCRSNLSSLQNSVSK